VALLAWLFEHRSNLDFPRAFNSGIWNAIWWAAVTAFTVGRGDKTPRTVPGRLIVMLWMGLNLSERLARRSNVCGLLNEILFGSWLALV
jgi:hypothetical protein